MFHVVEGGHMEEAWFSVVVGHSGLNRSTWGLSEGQIFRERSAVAFWGNLGDATEKIFQEIEIALDFGYS
jgi:hypothetical protein